MSSPSITCGMVIYNEIDQIKKIVPLIEDELKDYVFEWVIILNHENPQIRQHLKSWFNLYYSLAQVIENKTNNIGEARQKILENAKSDLIYFTDPDIEIQPGSIKKLIDLHEQQKHSAELIMGYGGPNLLVTHHSSLKRLFNCIKLMTHLNVFAFQIQKHHQLTKVDHLPTCHLLLKKTNALEIGGFSSDFKKIGEDLDFSHRAFIHQYQFIFHPQSEVLHWQNSNLYGWFKKCTQYGQAQIIVQKKYWPKLRFYRLLPTFIPLAAVSFCVLLNPASLAILILLIVAGEFLGISYLGFVLSILCYGAGELFEIAILPFAQKNVKQHQEAKTNHENKYF